MALGVDTRPHTPVQAYLPRVPFSPPHEPSRATKHDPRAEFGLLPRVDKLTAPVILGPVYEQRGQIPRLRRKGNIFVAGKIIKQPSLPGILDAVPKKPKEKKEKKKIQRTPRPSGRPQRPPRPEN